MKQPVTKRTRNIKFLPLTTTQTTKLPTSKYLRLVTGWALIFMSFNTNYFQTLSLSGHMYIYECV